MKKQRKNILRKEFLAEIRHSMGRFFSIFLIVALGVSLYVGISATEPDMILSGDTYADENNLMDIKIVSTYGLTEADVDAIDRLPSIDSAIGSYSVDVLCNVEDNLQVLHVMSRTEEMNLVSVTEGRMPKKENECFADEDFLEASGYKVGDEILLLSGTEAELTDTLKYTSYKIVGSGNTPLYYSTERGSSTIGNGTVSGFLIVQPEAFVLDVYTEIFAKADGAEDALSFTEKYEELVEEALEHIQLIQDVRCEIRLDSLAEEAQLEIDNARNELYEKKQEAEEELQKNEDELKDAELELKLGELQIQTGKVGIESGKAQIESGKAQIESAKAELEEGKAELEEYKSMYNSVMSALAEEKMALEEQLDQWEAQLEGMDEEQKEAALETISSLRAGIEELDGEIHSLTAEFEAELAAGEQQILEGEELIREQEAELAAAEKELAASEQQLKNSESQIASGKNEIEDGKTALLDARQEMEEQIADGEEELLKAEKEVADLETPVWYIFDRSSIPEYEGYGDNAARIGALSIVFPALFFLVAALISLTTMTRMVEEQRGQIGTMKALGFSDFAIIGKYLGYAVCATLGGSIFGVLIGEKLFPYVIISAYHMTVYTHVAYVLVPYRLGYAVIAVGIAVLCTGGAAMAACYKELLSQAAVLMRPEAPKIGKRTIIERIPFLWKHLNFSWKSSLRNLFRYKKRFFMTLFGIGGCMGLLMVGFGLRDSISSIAANQYGQLQLYDSSIYLSDDMTKKDREELEGFLEEEQLVDKYMNVTMENRKVSREDEEVSAYLVVIEDTDHLDEFFIYRDRISKKEYELGDEGVILTEKAADMLGVKAGGQVFISEDGKNERKVKITDICENYAGNFIYMTAEYYEKVYEETPFYNTILVKTEETATTEDNEQIGEKILEFDNILNVQYTENQSERLNGMLVALDKVMVLLIIVAGMLSFVVLYNLNNINITERRRELATLKVLGFFDLEVANYVYRENIMLTLMGVLVGCVVGKFLHYFTIITVEVDEAMFGRVISMESYIICALFTIGFSAFVNWMMYFKLKKIDMVESLKSVE